MDLKLYTDNELMQMRINAVESRDFKLYKEIYDELNRREREDL